jgi:TetR/AcrR family transcriptional repressor of nem operon
MRRGDATRERLLKEATHLVCRQGFSGTSVNTVLRAAGVKKGALYHHFPGKDDLGMAVLERDRKGFVAFLDSTLSAPTPLEGLDRFFAAALSKHQETGFIGGCLWGNTALEMSDTNPGYTKLVTKVFDEWLARIERVIRQGQETRQIRTDLPAADLARLVVAGMEGGIMMSRLTKQSAPFKTCLNSLRALLTQQGATSAPRATTPADSAA